MKDSGQPRRLAALQECGQGTDEAVGIRQTKKNRLTGKLCNRFLERQNIHKNYGMFYLLFGFAMGAFVSGLIAKIYTHESNWIPSKYLFGLSLIFLLIALFVSWGEL